MVILLGLAKVVNRVILDNYGLLRDCPWIRWAVFQAVVEK